MRRYSWMFCLCCLPWLAWADDAREQLAERLGAIETMSANFSQEVRSDGQVVQRSRGEMAILRPGKFRWNTHKPNEQLLVADGRRLWIYDVDLEQVQVKPMRGQLGQTPALFLSGYDQSALNDYQVRILKRQGQTIHYELIPKDNDATFAQITMTFRGDKLTNMQLSDRLGQITDLTFSKIKMNQTLPSRLFQFEAPAGVDVIDG
jgi:outer membrane lipoprotein carrier protein